MKEVHENRPAQQTKISPRKISLGNSQLPHPATYGRDYPPQFFPQGGHELLKAANFFSAKGFGLVLLGPAGLDIWDPLITRYPL